MCEGADHRRITRMDATGTVTTLAERWEGKRFNKPNDIVCRSDGSIFFTDPELRLPPAQRELGFSGVFRIDPQGHVHLATDACEYPNGLAFSPDESILYVAISRLDERCFQEEARGEVCTHRRIRAFDVAPDGSLTIIGCSARWLPRLLVFRMASKSIPQGEYGASAPVASG